MLSKTSFFNRTLFRKNLTRFWPLWGGASFVGALFPLALLLTSLQRHRYPSALDFAQGYYSVVSVVLPILSLIYAILCAMVVWGYLYNARSVSMMHTLPIRREGVFCTTFLSGMTMMLIPYTVVGLMCLLISLLFGALDPVVFAVTALAVIGESLFYFASATFTALVVGNIFALPAVYFLLHFLEMILEWLIAVLARGFLFGVTGGFEAVGEWLSPTVALEHHVTAEYVYTDRLVEQVGREPYTDHILTAVRLENAWVIGVYALVGVVLLVLAWLLYRRRHSETAGDVVAAGWLRPVFRYGVAALTALLGGMALYELLWQMFQYDHYYQALPMAVCMIVAGAIGYYAASMLLAKSLRVFRGSWRGLLLVAACCTALCVMLRYDVLGIEKRVPQVSETKTLEIRTGGNTYTLRSGENDELMEQVRQLHQAIVTDESYILYMDEEGFYTASEEEELRHTWTYVDLTYTLTNGTRVERGYSIPITADRLTQDGTYDSLLDQVVNSPAMKNLRLHRNDPRFIVTSGDLYVENSNQSYSLSDREAEAVLQAVYQDADSGAWGEYDWFDESSDNAYALNLDLKFEYNLPEQNQEGTDWINIVVRPGMDATVECLKELGLITDADLVTYGQLYASEEVYMESYEAVPDDSGTSVTETTVMAVTAS